jgi:hypothetical protein
VREQGSRKPAETHKLGTDFIHNMTRGKFAAPLLSIEIENKLSETDIHFSLNSEFNYPISCFPRRLIDDDKIQSSEWCDNISSPAHMLRHYRKDVFRPRQCSQVGRTVKRKEIAPHTLEATR